MQTLALKNRKLVDAKTLQEAEKILDAKNIGKTDAIRKLVGIAFKMTDESDKKHTLQEADESAMGKEVPYDSRGPSKNADEQKQNSEAREPSGDESQLHGNPGEGTGSDVPIPSAPAGDGDAQKTADEQSGDSQLGGANKETMPYYQMMGQQPSPDMLQKKIIELMDPTEGAGMSKVAAEQAAGTQARDQMGFLQEAMKPVLQRMWRDRQNDQQTIHNLQEAIKILQSTKETGKITLARHEGPGGNAKNQEAIMSDPTIDKSVQTLDQIANDPIARDSLQKDIMEQYCN